MKKQNKTKTWLLEIKRRVLSCQLEKSKNANICVFSTWFCFAVMQRGQKDQSRLNERWPALRLKIHTFFSVCYPENTPFTCCSFQGIKTSEVTFWWPIFFFLSQHWYIQYTYHEQYVKWITETRTGVFQSLNEITLLRDDHRAYIERFLVTSQTATNVDSDMHVRF